MTLSHWSPEPSEGAFAGDGDAVEVGGVEEGGHERPFGAFKAGIYNGVLGGVKPCFEDGVFFYAEVGAFFEEDGPGHINAAVIGARDYDGAAAGGGAGINGFLDGSGVEGLAIGDGAEVGDREVPAGGEEFREWEIEGGAGTGGMPAVKAAAEERMSRAGRMAWRMEDSFPGCGF
jgi:hypothetical protein